MAALPGSLVKTVTRSVLHLVTVAIAIGSLGTVSVPPDLWDPTVMLGVRPLTGGQTVLTHVDVTGPQQITVTQRMANAHVRRDSMVTSASFDVRKGIMGKTVKRNVIAITTSHVTQKMAAATSDVLKAEWVTAVIKLVVMEHGELTACMNAPARKESAIRSQGNASVRMDGMVLNAKMPVLQIGMVSSVCCSVSVRTTPCVTLQMAPVSVRRGSGAPSVTKCAPRGRMDRTVSTGVPVRTERSVTTSQGSVSVGRAGRA